MNRALILTSNRIDSRTIVKDLYSKAIERDRPITVRQFPSYFDVLIDNHDMIEIKATKMNDSIKGKRVDFLIMTQYFFNETSNDIIGSILMPMLSFNADNIHIINPNENNDWLYEKLFFTS